MANISAGEIGIVGSASVSNAANGTVTIPPKGARRRWMFLAAAIFLSPIAFAQNSPQVSGVDPASGKVNDTATVMGENLDKPGVSAVYLSDDKNDYKATVTDQSAQKIVIKIPQVKAGGYNISLQVGDKLFIKPVKFRVED